MVRNSVQSLSYNHFLSFFLWRRGGLLSNYSLPGWKFTYFTEIALASKHIAWLSLNFILSTSWVALYSVVCLWVRFQASMSPDQISTFSNIYRHTSPRLTLYHVIPSSASFYWLSTTKYQTVLPYTDPVPAGTTYNSSFRKAQLNNFSFYDSFDESRTVYLV